MCPPQYTYLAEVYSCYKFNFRHASSGEAWAICQMFGGYPVAFDTKQELETFKVWHRTGNTLPKIYIYNNCPCMFCILCFAYVDNAVEIFLAVQHHRENNTTNYFSKERISTRFLDIRKIPPRWSDMELAKRKHRRLQPKQDWSWELSLPVTQHVVVPRGQWYLTNARGTLWSL